MYIYLETVIIYQLKHSMSCIAKELMGVLSKCVFTIKDVGEWQFLTIEADETVCMVCLPPEEHRPFKKPHFLRFGHQTCIFTDLFKTVK